MATRSDSVYRDACELGIEIDHHESDLCLLDTPVANWLLAGHDLIPHRFIGTDGRDWLEVPFLYDPYWDAKRQEA